MNSAALKLKPADDVRKRNGPRIARFLNNPSAASKELFQEADCLTNQWDPTSLREVRRDLKIEILHFFCRARHYGGIEDLPRVRVVIDFAAKCFCFNSQIKRNNGALKAEKLVS